MQINFYRITGILFLFLLLVVHTTGFAGNQNVSAIRAMQLFDAGNYAEAEKMFGILLEEEPRNPMLNYYYGASRTETGNFSDEDLNRLLLAGKNVTPDRLNYYLGIQYHARNNWDQALKFYNQFRLSVPESDQQELQLATKIQQCYDKINPFAENTIVQNPEPEEISANKTEHADESIVLQEANEDFVIEAEPDTLPQNTEPDETAQNFQEENLQPEEKPESDTEKSETETDISESQSDFNIDRKVLPDLPGVKATYELPEGEQIEFQVNSAITYFFDSQFQTDEGKTFFEQGNALKQELEQKIREANKLRENYSNEKNPAVKAELGEKILSLENDSYNLQSEINRQFSSARNAENQYWNSAGSIATYNFQVELEKIQSALKGETVNTEESRTQRDSVTVPPAAVSEFFETNPAISSNQNDKLVYKIQIGAYSRGVPAYRQRLYKKLSFIRKIENYTDEKGVVVYTTGNLSNLEDAEKMRNQVKQEGIQDAVVVPYFNGKRITLEQAKKIEAGDDI